MIARVRRFDARAVVEERFADIRGVRVVVAKVLAEQPALRSWLLFCRREDRSIAPANAEDEGSKTLSTIEEGEKPTENSELAEIELTIQTSERRSKSCEEFGG
jgi:hypothetical protein